MICFNKVLTRNLFWLLQALHINLWEENQKHIGVIANNMSRLYEIHIPPTIRRPTSATASHNCPIIRCEIKRALGGVAITPQTIRTEGGSGSYLWFFFFLIKVKQRDSKWKVQQVKTELGLLITSAPELCDSRRYERCNQKVMRRTEGIETRTTGSIVLEEDFLTEAAVGKTFHLVTDMEEWFTYYVLVDVLLW